MCQWLLDNWKELVGFTIAGFGIYKYFDTRARELAWRRTEFIFKQAERLENDSDVFEIVTILENRSQGKTIEQIINESQSDCLQKLDKLLNLLDRLAYATLHRKTIAKEEIANFGWYLDRICQNETLVQYCNTHGFHDVLALQEALKK